MTSLYNLAPALRVMGMGALLAACVLLWLWWRQRGTPLTARLQALTLITLFLTFDLIAFGAFTRLTDSGLGCPDWPGCYGNMSPVGAHAEISSAVATMPTGPVTHGKAWIEMVHRYLATGVGALILALALATTWFWWRSRAESAATGAHKVMRPAALHPGWAWVTLIWVCVQGAFGALTVTMKLWPAIVTAHLLGGIGLLVLLVAQAEHYRRGVTPREAVSPALRALLWASGAALLVQIALGGWVSTNYAVLACTDFPTCQGSWWPAMDFARGFELWRPLGHSSDGALLPFAALTAIHYVHRSFAWVVFAALLTLVACLHRQGRLPMQRRALLVLTVLQLATGLSNVVLDWPLPAALLHTAGAAALLAVLGWALFASQSVHANHRSIPIGVSSQQVMT